MNEAASTPGVDPEKAEIKCYLERHEQLRTERMVWETHWQQCLKYIVPRKGDITVQVTPGTPRGDELFDTTAISSNQLLAAVLHSMLTNPSTRFFELLFGDPRFDDDNEVKAYLEDCADRMFVVMNNSNFQTEIHEIYLDQGAIGTACLYMGEDEKNVVHFNARDMKEIYVDENNLGLIDTVHREFKWTAKQIIQEFGEKNVPDYVVEQYKKGNNEKWRILHCVHPLEKDDATSEKEKLFAFRSAYILVEKELFLNKSGYREFPFAIPRWTKTSGEKYGRGPGMDMLPDIKMVDVMMETTLKGAQKTVDPPLMVQDDNVIGRVRLTPGGLTLVRPGLDFPIKPLITDARVDFGYQCVEDVRTRIRAGFYVDRLQPPKGGQMTATEYMQRTQEELQKMGPILGRQNFEGLNPIISRVFAIMQRKSLFKAPPEKIKGKKFGIRYCSLAAKAMRAGDGQTFSQAIQAAAPVIQAKPETLDKLNGDRTIDYIFGLYGVPQRVMNTDREIKVIRDARQKAQAQVQQQQQQAHQADIASKVLPGAAQVQQAVKQ